MHADSRALGRFVDRNAMLFALAFVVIPNLPFLLASIIFVPQRLIVVPCYFAAGLLSLILPRILIPVLFLCVAAFDLLVMVCRAFFLGPSYAFSALKYLGNINPAQSLFYVLTGLTMLTIAGTVSWIAISYRKQLRAASPTFGLLVMATFMLIDGKINNTWSLFMTGNSAPVNFDSAITQNGITPASVAARGTNLLVVIVEGLGAYSDENAKALIAGHLRTAALGGRFALSEGRSHYYGSTTGAESRELCGRWGDYRDYVGTKTFSDCLPHQMAGLGYETVAFHAFTSDMFDRGNWLPNIGFQTLKFENELLAENGGMLPNRCGSTFKGLCDPELAHAVQTEMTKQDGKRKLVYWLTLNTHVPFVAKPDSSFKCGSAGAKVADKTMCNLTELWSDLFREIANLASDPNLPPTDIIITGDHHTPLFRRSSRSYFVADMVDWYYLKDVRGKTK
jgi:hypothetical protein